MIPLTIVTDKLASYSAAKKELVPSVENSTVQYKNNGCKLSHQPTRQQERQMRKFKLHGQAQRFLSCHRVINNLSSYKKVIMNDRLQVIFRRPFVKVVI